MYKIAVFSSTRGTNFQSLIDAKAAGRLDGVEICCLVTDKMNCGAVDKAMEADIPVYAIDATGKTRKVFDEEVMSILAEYGVDLIVLGGYMRLIGKPMVDRYARRIINIHPSLLPKYRGMDLDVHEAVIDAGEKESGMTIHFVDEKMDHGEIILQKKVTMDANETPKSLKAKVQVLEKEWYPKVVEGFANGIY